MLNSNDVVSAQKNLTIENYDQFLDDLRRIGHPIKEAWHKSPLSNAEKYKFTENTEFKQFLVKEIKESKEIHALANSDPQFISRLVLFLMVWKDNPNLSQESEPGQLSVSESDKKRLRQLIKYKGPVNKDDCYAINIALQAMVFILYQQYEKKFIEIKSKKELIDFIPNNKVLALENCLQKAEKMGEAIKAFQTPNKKKKLLKYFGIFLALIASLACGLSTGGAIFLLFPSLPILGISLGAVIGLFGFTSNFGFFSQNFPNFMLSFLKKGGISEYIDTEGKRRQLSAIKKYLFIPLAVVASLTVGAGTVAITYTTVLALATKLLPILALIWPPLPLIIVGILAAAVGITLTVAVLTATIESIKNFQVFSVSWKNVKEKIKALTKLQILGYVFKGLLVLVGLFGLAYFRYTSGLDLSTLIGPIAAGIMGVVAYIPQAFFTIFSIQKLIGLFSPSITQQEETSIHSKSRFSRIKSLFYKIYTHIALVGNALGNAALVVFDSIKNITAWCIGGAIGGFFNSWSGNLSKPDIYRADRSQATQRIVQEYEDFLAKPKAENNSTNNPELRNNKVDQCTTPVKLKTRSHSAEERTSNSYNITAGLFQLAEKAPDSIAPIMPLSPGF